jgi:hypothetical protein
VFTQETCPPLPLSQQREEPAVRLPLRVLVAMPAYVARDPGAFPFNVPATFANLLASAGAERVRRIVQLRLWGPAWNDAELHSYFSSRFGEPSGIFTPADPRELRAGGFPGFGALADPTAANYPLYDIAHVTARISTRGGEPALRLSDAGEGVPLLPGALRDALVAAHLRLLVLHVPPEDFTAARRLADAVTVAGGPATLVAAAREAHVAGRYLAAVYARIIHNQPLLEVADPKPDADDLHLYAHLSYRIGAEGTLQWDGYLDALANEALRIDRTITLAAARADDFRLAASETTALRLDRVQELREMTSAAVDVISGRKPAHDAVLTSLQSLDWARESKGIIPAADAAEMLEGLASDTRMLEAIDPERVRKETRQPDRVLNANFVEAESQRPLEPVEGLVAGESYDLLVQIGPKWEHMPSIVLGHRIFPVAALPQDEVGWLLEAVVISDDFRPGLSRAFLWLPRGTGSSAPADPARNDEDGGGASGPAAPVAIRLEAPKRAGAATIDTARARLNIYYENNLLQSAAITAQIVPSRDVLPKQENVVDVDFALTNTFQSLDTQLAPRRVGLDPDAPSEAHQVALNITMNHDGAGGHRFIVKGNDGLASWLAFDPLALKDLLGDARRTLIECFYEKHPVTGELVMAGDGYPRSAFNAGNGKAFVQFQWDLMRLAELGHKLFYQALQQATPADPSDTRLPAERMRDLRLALAEGQVIQIARTTSTPAQYVFPWALVYELALPGPRDQYKWCPVVREWSEDGVRQKPLTRTCPHAQQHADNMLCPYGFWGLKHVIEQPASVLRAGNDHNPRPDLPSTLDVSGGLHLSLGLTRDARLSESVIDSHVSRLSGLTGVRVVPALPATDVDSVLAMLRAPQVVYFLCHGEYDAASKRAFLGVGPRDNDPNHRIYVTTVQAWASTTGANGFDLTAWKTRRPLIVINGCATANLAPGEILDFVSAFTGAGAAGVIGTEVSVRVGVATEIAERLLERMTRKPALPGTERLAAGEAMREMRWEMANKGNLIGLAYTLHCLSGLRFDG